MSTGKIPKAIKLDERNHVELPLLEQLTASFAGSSLIENNKQVLHLLLEGSSVSENRETGEKSPTVRFVDFADTATNDFTAVCQFKVRVLGTEHHIIPDITLFLNGLPVAVIECKSPKVKDAIPEAIDQLLRYSEQRGAKGEGSQPLFYYNQFVVATCRNQCKFGTITTHGERHFYRWADPYPRALDDLEHGASAPNDQQRLIARSRQGFAGSSWYMLRPAFGIRLRRASARHGSGLLGRARNILPEQERATPSQIAPGSSWPRSSSRQ